MDKVVIDFNRPIGMRLWVHGVFAAAFGVLLSVCGYGFQTWQFWAITVFVATWVSMTRYTQEIP